MMNPTISILLSLIIGFLIGAIYFTWLWRSIQALPSGPSRYRHLALKSLLRLFIILGVIAVILTAGVDVVLIFVGLLGFLAARIVMTTRIQIANQASLKRLPTEQQ